MTNPANQKAADRQTRALLARRLPGSRRGTVAEHLARAERIGAAIWRRWHIGPYRWQLKHVRWFLATQTEGLTASTRYRYWLTVRALVFALGHGDIWMRRLVGPWVRPTGSDLGTGCQSKFDAHQKIRCTPGLRYVDNDATQLEHRSRDGVSRRVGVGRDRHA